MDNDASNYRSRSDASRRLFGDRPADEATPREGETVLEADRRPLDPPRSQFEHRKSDGPFSSRPLTSGSDETSAERPSRLRSSLFDQDREPSGDDRGFGASGSSPLNDGGGMRSESSFDSPRETMRHGFERPREKSSLFDREQDSSSSVFSRDSDQRGSGLRSSLDTDSPFGGSSDRAPRLDRLGGDTPAPRKSFDTFDPDPADRSRHDTMGRGTDRFAENGYDAPRRSNIGREDVGATADDPYDWDSDPGAAPYDDGYQGFHARDLASVDETYTREYEYTDEAVDFRRAEPSGFEEFAQFDDQYEDYQDDRRRRGPFLLLGSLIGVAAIAGGLILVYKQGVREGQQESVPLVEAPVDPSKVEPTEPSGLQVSGRTKLIYDRIIGEATVTDETFESREEPLLDPNDQALTNGGNTQDQNNGQTAGTEDSDVSGNEPLPLPLPPPPNVSTDGQQSGLVRSEQETQIASNDQSASLQSGQTGLQTSDPDVPATVLQPIDDTQSADQQAAPQEDTASGEELPDQIAQLINSPPLPAEKPVPPSRLADPGPAVPTGEVEANALPGSVPREGEQQVSGLDQSGPTPLNLQPVQQAPVEQQQQQNLSGDGSGTPGGSRFADELGSGSQQPSQGTSLGDQLASVIPETITQQEAPPPQQSQQALSGRYVVQLASFSSSAEAEQEFARLRDQHGDALSGYQSFIEAADLGSRGVYHRLLIGPIEQRSAASQLCNSLISAGERDCFVRER